jgi:NADH-quinone oxidoreductase subunit A
VKYFTKSEAHGSVVPASAAAPGIRRDERRDDAGALAPDDARPPDSVKFYMVAMLFIIFDIETVFMIPWGAYYRQLSCSAAMVNDVCPAGQMSFFGLIEMLVFMAILLVGFVYVWKKGALQWD